MKILIVAPYHVSGTLDLWQKEHRRRGNECRVVTLFKSPFGFSEDICLNLPLQPTKDSFVIKAREALYTLIKGPNPEEIPIEEVPPFWKSPGLIPSAFFRFRDFVITPKVLQAFNKYDFDSFDVIWLDQGAEFFRDARIVNRWGKMGKSMISYYHGSDMRNRGIYPQIDKHVSLRLTCEVDLMHLDKRLEYLFLPYETDKIIPVNHRPGKKIRIAHAARVRGFKGTDDIIRIVGELEKTLPVELVLIENMTHAEAMAAKSTCDIAIDQIADTGGWGYGMSSVEYLSLGIPTCTSMVPEMETFIPDHPFIAVTRDTLAAELTKLIEDENYRKQKGAEGREWVVKYHDLKSVCDTLYGYFEREKWV